MANSNNYDVAEYVKRIARHLEKPPVEIQRGVSQNQSLRDPVYPQALLGNQTRGVVGAQGEGGLAAGP